MRDFAGPELDDDDWRPVGGEGFEELVSILGYTGTVALIALAPTTPDRPWRKSLYIPRRMPRTHWICAAVGLANARRLAAAMPNTILQPPSLRFVEMEIRRRRAVAMIAMGRPPAEVAAALGRSTAWVAATTGVRGSGPPEPRGGGS